VLKVIVGYLFEIRGHLFLIVYSLEEFQPKRRPLQSRSPVQFPYAKIVKKKIEKIKNKNKKVLKK